VIRLVAHAAGRRHLLTLIAAMLAWTGPSLVREARGGDAPEDAKQRQEVEAAKRLFASIPWQKGPCEASLGTIGTIRVPEGFMFTGREGAGALVPQPNLRCAAAVPPPGGSSARATPAAAGA
jgi:uncharacterized membrane-anchored protein